MRGSDGNVVLGSREEVNAVVWDWELCVGTGNQHIRDNAVSSIMMLLLQRTPVTMSAP